MLIIEFYTVLSNYYDDIFQTNEKAISLLKRAVPLEQSTTLLDLAAGTGAEAIELARQGYEVTATDLSDEMVKIMKRKVKGLELPMKPKRADMRNITGMSSDLFDGIYCIGNSLVHLSSEEEVIQVLNEAFQKLTAKGVLMIQIVNYDRIFTKNITAFPKIVNEEKGLTFERFYQTSEVDANKLTFQMRLTVDNNETTEVLESETELLPITRDVFLAIVEASEFSQCKIYGSFDGDTFTKESPALVALLTKG